MSAGRQKSPSVEDLLEPSGLPDDLKWIAAHHRLHPTDPVYLLLAWHWRRIQASEDTLAAAIVELKAALDARIIPLTEATETVAGVNEALAAVQAALEEKPGEWSAQLEGMLAQPLEAALSRLQSLEQHLGGVGERFKETRRHQLLAALLVGFALGVIAAVIGLRA